MFKKRFCLQLTFKVIRFLYFQIFQTYNILKTRKLPIYSHFPTALRIKTYAGVRHALPNNIQVSISFDVKQLRNSSQASKVKSGLSTCSATFLPRPQWHASKITDNGVNKKCRSSGAFGSWIWFLSLA